MLEDRDIQIAIGMPVKSPKHCHLSRIQAHANYSVGKATILSNNDVSFSQKMALVALRPFQMYGHYVVPDFSVKEHFQLKI
jgi:hypothetical protein